jgi:hypothetical protein
MIDAAEQIFEKDGEYSSLIWLNYSTRPLIFLIHEYGTWKGWPDLCEGQLVRFPHPGTVGGFAFLIDKVGLELGVPIRPEQPFQTEVADDPCWEFKDSYGRLLRLESPGMNWHVEY